MGKSVNEKDIYNFARETNHWGVINFASIIRIIRGMLKYSG